MFCTTATNNVYEVTVPATIALFSSVSQRILHGACHQPSTAETANAAPYMPPARASNELLSRSYAVHHTDEGITDSAPNSSHSCGSVSELPTVKVEQHCLPKTRSLPKDRLTEKRLAAAANIMAMTTAVANPSAQSAAWPGYVAMPQPQQPQIQLPMAGHWHSATFPTHAQAWQPRKMGDPSLHDDEPSEELLHFLNTTLPGAGKETLHEYCMLLQKQGVETVNHISAFTFDDLAHIGIKMLHARILREYFEGIQEATKVRQTSNDIEISRTVAEALQACLADVNV